MKPPCKDCPDRLVTEEFNCHSACEKYQEYVRQSHKRYEARAAESEMAEFRKASIGRMERRKRRSDGA